MQSYDVVLLIRFFCRVNLKREYCWNIVGKIFVSKCTKKIKEDKVVDDLSRVMNQEKLPFFKTFKQLSS